MWSLIIKEYINVIIFHPDNRDARCLAMP